MIVGVGDSLESPPISSMCVWNPIHGESQNTFFIGSKKREPFIVEAESVGRKIDSLDSLFVFRVFHDISDHIRDKKGFSTKEFDVSTSEEITEEINRAPCILNRERRPVFFYCWAVSATEVALTGNGQKEPLGHDGS
jgi:hypothetical protein